ncbi:hypothetical protein SeSPB_A1187 [Salmonella enterica subsp. enterica serovar Saintpaul str. SARA29]|nr:hypothetical protein SeSPB_A1187 [Salmonella enterica subsp. enterica serovar Saintpaul str. SARA29]
MHYTAPACGFHITKIFQSEFFTNDTASPRQCWGYTAIQELKRMKKNSAFFSFTVRRVCGLNTQHYDIK